LQVFGYFFLTSSFSCGIVCHVNYEAEIDNYKQINQTHSHQLSDCFI